MARINPTQSPELHDAIRRRAEEIYLHSGCIPGRDLENWRQAEAEILRQASLHSTRRALVVKVHGVVFTGEYESAAAAGYTPGEWKAGAPVPVRFAGDKMFVKRPNGTELETRVVSRERANSRL